jgi:hypothetical protein
MDTLSSFATHEKVLELCEILGVNPSHTAEIKITIPPEDAITITIVQYATCAVF